MTGFGLNMTVNYLKFANRKKLHLQTFSLTRRSDSFWNYLSCRIIFLLAASVWESPSFFMTLRGIAEWNRLSCLPDGEKGSSSDEELKRVKVQMRLPSWQTDSPGVSEGWRRVHLNVWKLIDLLGEREDDVRCLVGLPTHWRRGSQLGLGPDWFTPGHRWGLRFTICCWHQLSYAIKVPYNRFFPCMEATLMP